jgi:glycine cleavage system H protein
MADRRAGPHGEWLEREGNVVTVGLTRPMAEQLGTIIGVHFPEITANIHRGEVAVVLEASKAAIDCEAPVSGTVKAVNFSLIDSPGLVNEAPEFDGWLYRLENVEDHEWDKLPFFQDEVGEDDKSFLSLGLNKSSCDCHAIHPPVAASDSCT